MREQTGDLFDYIDKGSIIIPVNIGWGRHKENIMGRGVALRAKTIWPNLPLMVGVEQRAIYDTGVMPGVTTHMMFRPDCLIYAFPTKPYGPRANRSWMNSSNLDLVKTSALELKSYIDLRDKRLGRDLAKSRGTIGGSVYLPRVGCGNGGLEWSDVRTILKPILDDRFVVVNL